MIDEVNNSERERLERLYSYGLTSQYEHSGTFQHIARMAAHIFHTPVALVNFVDNTAVYTNASVGILACEVDRAISLCSIAILKDTVTVFENAKEELCLLTNPIVHGELGIQFYAAAPICTPDGYNIGAVAVADHSPRKFPQDKRRILEGLAATVMDELEQMKWRQVGFRN